MKQKVLKYTFFGVFAFVSGILGAFTFSKIYHQDQPIFKNPGVLTNQPLTFSSSSQGNVMELNQQFISAASKCKNSVVFIKAIKNGSDQNYFYFDMFFDFFNNQGPSTSSGSGVIVSEDGYIVTNNHVVKDADKLEVVVANRKKTYTAEVIGTDAASDLALLKISETGLPFIEFTNSDLLQVGEWVLAVGNPFNLTSTVTSGIVSAKGRNINIVKNNFPIESFIQTDAAINAGNSGGALVNLDGKLVGINTAILSQTGSYSGYGFAIPANIVAKVIKDFKEFGMLQRAFIEAEVIDIDERVADKIHDININGVYVNKVTENGNAYNAGMVKGDIIVRFNSVDVTSRAVFDELLAYMRPGDKVKIEVLRDNKVIALNVPLNNSEGAPALLKNTTIVSTTLGASFQNLSKLDKDYYGIDYGVKISSVKNGLIKTMGLSNGFIILYINNQKVVSAEDLVSTLEKYKGWLTVKGVTQEGWMVTRSAKIN